MTNKITQKITGYRVKNSDTEQLQEQTIIESSVMHEGIKRDTDISGKTYKIKIPTSEHAIYVTVNHMQVVGVFYPYETFINCKDVSHQQWITALTRLISAVFRKGGNVRFIADELLQVCDPQGGHWTKKGANGEKPRFMPSLVAEIGLCLEKHFDYIDMLNSALEPEKWPILIETKEPIQSDEEEPEYPKNAEICPSCKQKSAMRLDGCLTCVNGDCNYSKCG
jgi:hypothetical protein